MVHVPRDNSLCSHSHRPDLEWGMAFGKRHCSNNHNGIHTTA